MNGTPLIELKDVEKVFQLESGNEIKVLDNIQLAVNENEIVALLGASGSGKSTCLRIMSGLIEATSGATLLRGAPLVGINDQVALVFQSFALFPWETVFTNIALALKPLGITKEEIEPRVKRVIDLVGLEGFEEAYPRELSGGMKQRVGIARALVMERPILFLDEPFSALDVLTADTLRTEISELFHEKKTATKSVVLVTHNIQEAVLMADRILVMGANPGRIRREIKNTIAYPRLENSPQFLEMVSFIHSSITETLMSDAPVITQESNTERVVHISENEAPIEALPQVQIGEVIGLVEAVYDKGGQVDLYVLSQKTGKDFGSLIYLVKAAELLDLLDTPRQMVILTDVGRKFVDGDVNYRKKTLHSLLEQLRIVKLTANILRKQADYKIDIESLSERVSEWLPNENPTRIIETLISWGRYAEYFGYSDDSKEIYLDVGQENA